MKTTAEAVRAIAEAYDAAGKPEHPITTRSSRSYMRRLFKPEKRGGALMCGKHEVVVRKAPQTEQASA
jgi:hypothetical protein